MFTLTIPKTNSKYYPYALKAVDRLRGSVSDGIARVELNDIELMRNYQMLSDLVALVHKWKGVHALYNDAEVDAYHFIFVSWDKIAKCAQRKHDTENKRHCWRDQDRAGWGCRLLTPFKLEIDTREVGEYMISSRYWYNFGEFESPGIWRVNKAYISEMIGEWIASNDLTLCPYFDLSRINQVIGSLPERIEVDGYNYIVFHREGQKVNIRHTLKHFAFTRNYSFSKLATYGEIQFLNYVSSLELGNISEGLGVN